MKVALLGPEGTFTHQAAEEYFTDLQPCFCSTIEEVFESDIEVKLVPVENSLGGGVRDTIDLLRESENNVTGEKLLPINHTVVSSEESIEDVDTVVSHPQALAQCQNFVAKYGLDTREADSTADAAEKLSSGEAALASKVTADIYDLNVLGKSVQDEDTNTTRFLILNSEVGAKPSKTSLILEPEEDRPGILHAMLSCFSGHQINLTHIQSRPTKQELGKYYFYVEAEVHGQKLEKAVKALETYGHVDKLGEYPEAEK
ncbi:MAG: prephenate dehydratase [Candidatus Nanosalina sp. J07AB43]|nr:MAG: prephenate dehydratase [Candidatus Nanosalina sp. J07AB43]